MEKGTAVWKCLEFKKGGMLNKKEDKRWYIADPGLREMKGRRDCVGCVKMDGWKEVGCCVTC